MNTKREQRSRKPKVAKGLKYPEHTTGSQLARETREKTNDLTEQQREELFRRGMQLIYGGDPETQTLSPRH